MSDSQPPSADRVKPAKATRIDEESRTFKWLVPAALILISLITVILLVASAAVILDILPRG